jgi:hypothetical protein
MLTLQADFISPQSQFKVQSTRMRLTFYHLTLLLVFTTTIDYRLLGNVAGIPSITLTEIVAYTLLVLYMGRAAFINSNWYQQFRSIAGQNPMLFVYFGWAAMASIVGLLRSPASLQVFKNLIPSLIVYFFILLSINSENRLKSVLRIYLFGISLNVLLGVLQVSTHGFFFTDLHDITLEKTDYLGAPAEQIAVGLFVHPNGFATFLIPSIILVISLFFWKRSKSPAIFFPLLGLCLLILYNLYFTYTRGAVAWILLATPLFLIPDRLSRLRFPAALFVLTLGSSSIVLYSLWSFLRYSYTLGTVITRLQLWLSAALAIYEDRFISIFGNGFSRMLESSAIYSHMQYPNSHNALLNQALAYGLPALVFYVLMYLSSLRQIAEILPKSNGFLRVAALFLYISLVALFGDYIFEPADQSVVLQAHFFLLLGLVAAIARLTSGYPRRVRSRASPVAYSMH